MIVLIVYCLFTYIFGAVAIYDSYHHDRMLKGIDLLMFLMAPISMTNVVMIHLLSHVVNLDAVIIEKPMTED